MFSELKTGVFTIFKQLKCNTKEGGADLMLEGITESNLENYLTLIEERAIDLLQAYARKKAAEDGTTFEMEHLVTSLAQHSHTST